MKIGSVDYGVSTVAYAAILIVLALMVPMLAMSRWGTIREAWHRNTIINATVEGGDNIEAGIAACKALIASDASRGVPRLHLGCLLASIKNYKEAKEAFESVQDASKATPEERSLGLVGAGCVVALDGAKDGKPERLDEAERLFQKAIDAQATPDALAAMAALKSWKGGAKNPEVQALVSRALAGSPAPSPGLQEQLYRLNGAVLAGAHKSAESSAAFRGVRALNPVNTQTEESIRMALLEALNQPGLDSETRRKEIDKLYQEIDKFGKLRGEALLAIGLAWTAFKDDPDYATANGPFDKARQAFRQAVDVNLKDPRPHKNLAALFNDRTLQLGKELKIPVPGFTGELTGSSTWTTTDKTPAAPATERIPKTEQDKINKILGLLREEEAVWKRFLDVGAPSKEDKIDAMIRMVACIRRQSWISAPDQTLQRDFLSKRALEIITQLIALDESGYAQYVQGLVLIDKGDLAGARASMIEAGKHGYKSPHLEKMLVSLDSKTRIIDSGPNPLERRFGSAQLVRATFETPLGASALKGANVTLDKKKVSATVYGSQLLYVANPADMTGGKHTIRISVGEAGGPAIDFPEVTFGVDKDAPQYKLTPAPGSAPISNEQVIELELTDDSGIDWTTLSAGIKGPRGANTLPFDAVIIRDGHYPHALARIEVKTGQAVNRSPVKLTPSNSMPSGEVRVWFEVKDIMGNKLKDEKTYIVK